MMFQWTCIPSWFGISENTQSTVGSSGCMATWWLCWTLQMEYPQCLKKAPCESYFVLLWLNTWQKHIKGEKIYFVHGFRGFKSIRAGWAWLSSSSWWRRRKKIRVRHNPQDRHLVSYIFQLSHHLPCFTFWQIHQTVNALRHWFIDWTVVWWNCFC